ncbi:MAG: cytochrome c peroxidase [Kiritimatiellae bacterium]|nr:cytochrome c peroxidase [Kiritimatiellia bacterium]
MNITKKHVVIVALTGVVAVLALPIINLIQGQRVPEEFVAIKCGSAEMTAAKEIIGNKCMLCHMQDPVLPFYAVLPVVGQQIKRDVADGVDRVNFISFYKNGGDDQALMAKLEHAVRVNNMPPKKFLAIHWDTALNSKEKAAILRSAAKVRAEKYATNLAATEFMNDAVQPLPATWHEKLSPAKIALGKRLFNDKRLSDDDTISCASCHGMDKGGTDQAQVSTGVRDQLGPINSPTVFNAAYNIMQFWDGRAKDLAEQANGPPLDPLEMASNWEQIIGKLKKDAELTAIYVDVYGSAEWTDPNIRDAIAEFEKTLLTPDSDLDKYLKGDATAISGDAAEGYALFKSHSCGTCHTGPAMGGQSFERPIDPVAYYAFRNKKIVEKDFGRFNATKQEQDRFKMKVPLLRNIALTAPYMHDGFTSDLAEVVTIMHDHFVTPSNRERLSAADIDKIVAMLNANTGTLPL